MTVTYEKMAEFLLEHYCYYYRPDRTVHCYVTAIGSVRFFANWGHGETRDYASLKSLYEAEEVDLPSAQALAEVTTYPLKFFGWAHQNPKQLVTVDAANLRAILDYLHDSEADHYDPEAYPEEANTHVYAHVLAIEARLSVAEKGGAE